MWQSGDAATPRRGRANRGRRPRLQRRQGVAANAVRLFIRGSAPPPAAAQTRSSISCLIVFSWQCLLAPPPTPSAPPTSLLRGEQPQKAQNHKKTVFSHRGTSVAINRGVSSFYCLSRAMVYNCRTMKRTGTAGFQAMRLWDDRT